MRIGSVGGAEVFVNTQTLSTYNLHGKHCTLAIEQPQQLRKHQTLNIEWMGSIRKHSLAFRLGGGGAEIILLIMNIVHILYTGMFENIESVINKRI